MKNPLDEWKQLQAERTVMYQYFLKVVPTLYEFIGKSTEDTVNSNQYSVTDYKREFEGGWDERGKLPGVFFFYDVSPIMVCNSPNSHTVPPTCNLNVQIALC
jgi:hypothetical protein